MHLLRLWFAPGTGPSLAWGVGIIRVVGARSTGSDNGNRQLLKGGEVDVTPVVGARSTRSDNGIRPLLKLTCRVITAVSPRTRPW